MNDDREGKLGAGQPGVVHPAAFRWHASSNVARIDRQSHTFEWGDGPMQYIVREG